MAITTDLERHRGRSRPTATGALGAGDRNKRFARSVRHTRIVRTLRWLLPFAGVASLGLYAATVMDTMGWVDGLPQIKIPNIMPENLTMANPRYEGFNKDGGSYVVAAKTAVQDLSDTSHIKLNGITGDLVDANKVKTKLTATRGTYDTKKNVLELLERIEVISDNGMHANLTSATILTKDSVILSKEPVSVEMPAGSIRSKEMTVRNKTREVTFLDTVVAHLDPGKNSQKPNTAPVAAGPAGTPMIGAANGPIDITANRLDINDAGKTATFSGAVRAAQGDAVLETAALEISYEGQPAGGTAPPSGASQTSAKIRRILSKSPVTMTRAPQDRVTSRSLDFDAIKQVAVLTGDVIMTSGTDRRVSGDTATINQQDDTLLLTGDIVAVQGRNELKGRRLFVERATGRTELTSPPTSGATQPGRIYARFFSSNANAAQPAKKQSESQGPRKAGIGSTAAVFKTDPNAPIDIEADRLNVDDQSKVAIFRGNVRAVQGDVVMRTSVLRASYNGAAGLAEASAEKGQQLPAKLKLVEASNKVIVTSKDGQKATGDWAKFDVAGNTVTLGGDVVLTQANNIVRGTRLVIDMTTGQSTIQTDPGAAWSAKARPASDASTANGKAPRPVMGGRPSAIFYPQNIKGKSKKGRAPASNSPGRSPAADSWEPSAAAP